MPGCNGNNRVIFIYLCKIEKSKFFLEKLKNFFGILDKPPGYAIISPIGEMAGFQSQKRP